MPQKYGGWSRALSTPLVGTARFILAWSDLTGIPYLAAGTEQRLEVLEFGELHDITPLRSTDNVTVNFSTVISTPTVTVHDVTNNAALGDWVNIVTTVSVGGLLLQGLYIVTAVIDADNYQIVAASNATATVNNGGAVALFTTLNTTPTVTVTLNNHGLLIGSLYTVHVSTTVATVVINGSYNVVSVADANNFVITANSTANNSLSGSENAGQVRIEYLIPSGFASDTPVSGYGVGFYGAGLYGVGTGTATAAMRVWFLDHFGQVLVATYNGGPIYGWTPPTIQPASVVATAPAVNTGLFVISPTEILVAIGSSTGMTQDPNLIRWSNAGDYTDFVATTINQAGSFRLPTGSMIVGGLFSSQQALIWTDIDVYSMTYINLPFVFGFNRLGNECGLIGPHAVGVIGGQTLWMSHLNFYTLMSGGATALQCPVWDQVFGNLYPGQLHKITCAVNAHFNEISWYFPSAGGTGEVDTYVKYNILEQVWDYGSLTRTAWSSVGVTGFPMGVDENRLIQQHETGNDADGAPMVWFVESGYIDIAFGEDFAFIDQFFPDVAASTTPGAVLQVTIFTTKYADDTAVVAGPYLAPFPTDLLSVRARGRQAAVRFGSQDLGSFIRLGNIRFRYSDDGAN